MSSRFDYVQGAPITIVIISPPAEARRLGHSAMEARFHAAGARVEVKRLPISGDDQIPFVSQHPRGNHVQIR